MERLKHVFLAETISDQVCIDSGQQDAVVIKDAEFAWFRQAESVDEKGRESKQDRESERDEKGSIEQSSRPIAFRVADVSMNVPRGSLVAIIGPVGCGKSSLILGLLGEMPRTQGTVTFAGKVAYCSQMAWIQNATLVGTCVTLFLLRLTYVVYSEIILYLVDLGMKSGIGPQFGMLRSREIWNCSLMGT